MWCLYFAWGLCQPCSWWCVHSIQLETYRVPRLTFYAHNPWIWLFTLSNLCQNWSSRRTDCYPNLVTVWTYWEEMARSGRGSMPNVSANSWLNTAVSIAYQFSTYGQLSKPCLQPCLNPFSRFKFRALGLLEPFVSQIWVSVRGWGRITELGSCVPDLGSGIGEGGGG